MFHLILFMFCPSKLMLYVVSGLDSRLRSSMMISTTCFLYWLMTNRITNNTLRSGLQISELIQRKLNHKFLTYLHLKVRWKRANKHCVICSQRHLAVVNIPITMASFRRVFIPWVNRYRALWRARFGDMKTKCRRIVNRLKIILQAPRSKTRFSLTQD